MGSWGASHGTTTAAVSCMRSMVVAMGEASGIATTYVHAKLRNPRRACEIMRHSPPLTTTSDSAMHSIAAFPLLYCLCVCVPFLTLRTHNSRTHS